MMRVFPSSGKARMRLLLGLLVFLVVLDGLLTMLLEQRGLAQELNPFLQPLVGDISFIVIKLAGSLLCAFVLWDIYRHFPKVALITTWVAVAGYSIIVLWNTSLFLLA